MPARIYEADGDLRAEVIDVEVPLLRVWHARGVRIDEEDFRQRVAEIQWLRQHRPNHPLTRPEIPVNPLDIGFVE